MGPTKSSWSVNKPLCEVIGEWPDKVVANASKNKVKVSFSHLNILCNSLFDYFLSPFFNLLIFIFNINMHTEKKINESSQFSTYITYQTILSIIHNLLRLGLVTFGRNRSIEVLGLRSVYTMTFVFWKKKIL